MSIDYETSASLLCASALSLREDLLKHKSYYTDLLESAYYHKHKRVGKLVKKKVSEYKTIIYMEPSELTLSEGLVQPDKMKAWGFYQLSDYEPEDTEIEMVLIQDEMSIKFNKKVSIA